MARQQSRKRKDRHDISPEEGVIKKQNRRRFATIYPPSFYDNLCELPLTTNVLLEFNDRNKTRRQKAANRLVPLSLPHKNIFRFARGGGPDLQHLRQFGKTSQSHPAMGNTQPSGQSGPTMSTTPEFRPLFYQRSCTGWGNDFEIHLRQNNIYVNDNKSTPLNIEELRAKLRDGLASSSPAQVSQEQFSVFKQKNAAAVNAQDVMADIYPEICGPSSILSQRNVLLSELTPITDGDIPRPTPKRIDGQNLQDLSMGVRNNHDIKQKVIPTKQNLAPVAMNFIMEVRAGDPLMSQSQRQACYYGAYGARAMSCLQNHGKAQKEYDGNAYTFTSIYFSTIGMLDIYAHHVTSPCQPGGREEYHMTLVDRFMLLLDLASFESGISAFRNARKLAQQYRIQFIQAANARHIVRDA